MTDVLFREHTDAVIATLKEVDLVVGDGEAPDEAGRQDDGSFVQYVVVYRIPGGDRSGNLDDPHGDVDLIYQVTCVGSSRREAEWLFDKVDTTLLAADVAPAGRSVTVVPRSNPGVQRDDDEAPAIFNAAPRYRLISTPS